VKILARYLAASLGAGVLAVLFLLTGLFALFDLANELGDVGRGHYGLYGALAHVLFSVPGFVHELFPVCVVVGAVLALALLGRNNELLALSGYGLSRRACALLLLRSAGLPLAALAVLNGELLAPFAERTAREIRAHAAGRDPHSWLGGELWLRTGDTHAHIGQVVSAGHIRDVTLYRYGAGQGLREMVRARRGWRAPSHWLLEEVETVRFSAAGASRETQAARQWRLSVSLETLGSTEVPARFLPMPVLFDYARYLAANRQSSPAHEFALWSRLLQPGLILVMVLLSLPLARLELPGFDVAGKVLAAAFAGIGYHVLARAAYRIGTDYGLPPALLAALPLALLAVFCLALFRRMR